MVKRIFSQWEQTSSDLDTLMVVGKLFLLSCVWVGILVAAVVVVG